MYFKIGNTKILVGKYTIQGVEKIEINFEYLFLSYGNYRRFGNIVTDINSQNMRIKIKSDFKNPLDCQKLSKLLIGVEKIITQENIYMLDTILEEQSHMKPQHFLEKQQPLLDYFL